MRKNSQNCGNACNNATRNNNDDSDINEKTQLNYQTFDIDD